MQEARKNLLVFFCSSMRLYVTSHSYEQSYRNFIWKHFYYVCIHYTRISYYSVFHFLLVFFLFYFVARSCFIVCIFCPRTYESKNDDVTLFRLCLTRAHTLATHFYQSATQRIETKKKIIKRKMSFQRQRQWNGRALMFLFSCFFFFYYYFSRSSWFSRLQAVSKIYTRKPNKNERENRIKFEWDVMAKQNQSLCFRFGPGIGF